MVRATNRLIEAAIRRGRFDYHYLLSGQCFPIRPLSWLKRVLADGLDYIDCMPMPQPSKPMTRLEKRVVNVKIRGRVRYRIKSAAEKVLNLVPVPNFHSVFGLIPYAGSQWWCLKQDTLEHIQTYRQQHSAYDRFMRWTHCPDEMYYQTLVANGPARERIANSLTGDIWNEGREHPEILTRVNLPVISSRKVFLARKFQTDDHTLLDDLEKRLL